MKIVLIYNLIDRIIIIITLIVFHLVLVYFGCSQSSQTGSGNMGYTRLMMLRGTCPCLCRIFFSGSKLHTRRSSSWIYKPLQDRWESEKQDERKEGKRSDTIIIHPFQHRFYETNFIHSSTSIFVLHFVDSASFLPSSVRSLLMITSSLPFDCIARHFSDRMHQATIELGEAS